MAPVTSALAPGREGANTGSGQHIFFRENRQTDASGLSAANDDAFIVGFNKHDGSLDWQKSLGGVGADSGNAIAYLPDAPPSAFICVTGYAEGNIDYDGSYVSGQDVTFSANNGQADVFVICLTEADPTTVMWTKARGLPIPPSPTPAPCR